MADVEAMRNGYPDLIVVGAGVLGAFHAYFAARRGWSVLLLDRNSRPNGASTRNGGLLARASIEPQGEWAAHAAATRAIYQALQAEGELSLRASGSLFLAQSEAEAAVLAELAAAPAWREHCGFLSAAEAQARHPWLRRDGCVGALRFPDDLSFDPQTLLPRLLERWIVSGLLRYRPCTNVVGVTAGGLRATIHSADGAMFHAARVLICGGADYNTLFPSRLRASGVRLCKLQMLRTAPQPLGLLPHTLLTGRSISGYPAFCDCPSFPLLLQELEARQPQGHNIQLLVRQRDDGSVVIGASCEQFSLDEAAAQEERTQSALNAAMLTEARRLVRLHSWELAEHWNSYYLAHPQLPIVSTVIDSRIQLITGLGSRGMAVAPGYAQANVQSWG